MFISLLDCRTEECETCDPIETCTKCNSGRYLLTTGTTTTCPRMYLQISHQLLFTLSKYLYTSISSSPSTSPLSSFASSTSSLFSFKYNQLPSRNSWWPYVLKRTNRFHYWSPYINTIHSIL